MRVLIADVFPERFLEDFRSMGADVTYDPTATAEQLPDKARAIDVLIVRSTKVDRRTIEGAKTLAMVLRAGAGYDTIDVDAASERGIYVANCPGKNAVAVAELAFGLVLALDRRIADATSDLKSGRWNKKEYGKAAGLKGRTIGVAGLGSIGLAVIDRAKAFEMRVLSWSRSLDIDKADALGVERCASIHELADRSDVVTVHLAQTKETRGMFDATFFARMKKGAMFINTSRGGLHDEAALARAMKERGIRAGLDVFSTEPASATAEGFTPEVATLSGFVGTHHIGASTEQAQDAIAAEAVRITREFILTGRPPNVVNVETRAPAMSEIVVRHYDKVGVLAHVLGIVRKFDINVAEMTNTIFRGQKAAVAVIRVESEPPAELLKEIMELEDMVIAVEAKRAS